MSEGILQGQGRGASKPHHEGRMVDRRSRCGTREHDEAGVPFAFDASLPARAWVRV
jgi:hypothetical protein